MANSIVMPEEAYGFNYEWIAAGSGIGEEICGVDKDCIVVPTSPVLPKIEQIETEVLGDDYVEIQVTEEEVVTDQWTVPTTGCDPEDGGLVGVVDGGVSLRRGPPSHEELMVVADEDEYSRLHPYPCDFCSRRFSNKSSLTVHMVSHQVDRPHRCNLCGATYRRKYDLVEHMKIHAYAPVKTEVEEDDYDDFTELPPQTKIKQKTRRKKRTVKKQYRYREDEEDPPERKVGAPVFKSSPPYVYEEEQEDTKFELEEEEVVSTKFPVLNPSRPYVCQHCGIGFAREKALTSHTMVHVGDSAYECETCGDMFQSSSELESHRVSRHYASAGVGGGRKRSHGYTMHHEDSGGGGGSGASVGTFQCNECGLIFQWFNQLKKHRKSHVKEEEESGGESHVCSLCNLVFNTMDELLCHKEDHDPDIGVHSCFLCGEVYESVTDLKEHMRSRHKSSHMCHLCEKMFKDEKGLSRHLASHMESKSFPCSVCSRRFHNKARLKKHMSIHEDVRAGGLTCRECGSTFPDGQTLLTHRQSVHGINLNRMFPCMQCGKAFNSRSSHQIHLRIHTGERPYGCRYCWKAFGDGGTLRKHERIHTGEKPYVCPVCSKAFNQRVVLREHIRAHHSGSEGRLNDARFVCVVCGSIFGTSSELCAHLVLHSDENTAKSRAPKARKYVRKRRFPMLPPGCPEGTSEASEDSGEEESRKKPALLSNNHHSSLLESPPELLREEPLIKTELVATVTSSSLLELGGSGRGRARIVRSGKKGAARGQNKRYMKGKTKAARLLNNTSYASKYVVTRSESEETGERASGDTHHDAPYENGSLSPPSAAAVALPGGGLQRSRPRTKNVSYHNPTRGGQRFEAATFPTPAPSPPLVVAPTRRPKIRRGTSKRVLVQEEDCLHERGTGRGRGGGHHQTPTAQHFDNDYVNGIGDFFDEGSGSGEQIETCIVDDIGVELKLEVKSPIREDNAGSYFEIGLRTEVVACDMCSEVFTSRSDLLKHIQVHI